MATCPPSLVKIGGLVPELWAFEDRFLMFSLLFLSLDAYTFEARVPGHFRPWRLPTGPKELSPEPSESESVSVQ